MLRALGQLDSQDAAGRQEFGESSLLLSDRRAVWLNFLQLTPCRIDVDLERAHLLDEGQEPGLERVQGVEFVVGVDDLGDNAV